MVRQVLFAALAVFAVSVAFTACDETSPIAGPEGGASVRLAGMGDCKDGGQVLLAGEQDGGRLLVTAMGSGKVSFTHQDAIFNCCIDSVALSVQVDGPNITITETEHSSQPCFCVCPYDLDGEIVDLQTGVYSLAVRDENGEVLCTAEVTVN